MALPAGWTMKDPWCVQSDDGRFSVGKYIDDGVVTYMLRSRVPEKNLAKVTGEGANAQQLFDLAATIQP